MSLFFRWAVLLSMLLPARVLAQRSVVIDLTRPVYDSVLDYSGTQVTDVRRSYGNPNINEVSIRLAAGFADATFKSTSDFSKAYFHGSSDFRGVHFMARTAFTEARFFSVSSFISARFDSSIYFSGTYFDLATAFMGAGFHSTAFFAKTVFKSPGVFSGAHFYAESEFANAQFRGMSNFSTVHFDSSVLFTGAEFHSTVFNNAEFHAKSDFTESGFCSNADFSSAHFYSTANFQKAHFDSATNFSNATFDKDVNFSGAHFKHSASLILSKIKVNSNTGFDFSHAVLPDTIDFSNNPRIFSGTASYVDFILSDSLNGTRYSITSNIYRRLKHAVKGYFYPNDTCGTFRKHKINLYNTDVSKVRIDYDRFKFYACESDNSDSSRSGMSVDVIQSIYDGLLKNFKDRGQMDSYEKLDIEYRRYKAGFEPGEFSWQEFWWRFGYEKWRIFIHAILLILIFSCINAFFIEELNNRSEGIYSIQIVPELIYSYPRRFQRGMRRFWCALVYTTVLFFSIRLKMEKIKFSRSTPGTLWVIFIYAAGLVCMGFIVNLILQR